MSKNGQFSFDLCNFLVVGEAKKEGGHKEEEEEKPRWRTGQFNHIHIRWATQIHDRAVVMAVREKPKSLEQSWNKTPLTISIKKNNLLFFSHQPQQHKKIQF